MSIERTETPPESPAATERVDEIDIDGPGTTPVGRNGGEPIKRPKSSTTPSNEAEILRTYLRGWRDGQRCLDETLSWIPDEQLASVMRIRRERANTDPKENA